DPALLATASRQAYLHELERVRGTLSGDRVLLTRARRVGGRLVQRANVLVPASRGWSWAINVDTLGEPMAWVLPDGAMLVRKRLVQAPFLTEADLAAIFAHVIAHALAGDDARAAAAGFSPANAGPDPNAAVVELAAMLEKLIRTPHYDTASERAAGAMAIQLLARSGINPAAASAAWRKIAQIGASSPLVAMHP